MFYTEVITTIQTNGDPQKAVIYKNYHKSELDFFGWAMPDLRRLASRVLKQFSEADPFFVFCAQLWALPVFETRMLVNFMLAKRLKYFCEEDFTRFLKWFNDCDGWALTDLLAIPVLGEYLIKYPQFQSDVDHWKTNQNLWVRRAGILRFISPARHKEPWPEKMETILVHHFTETDFFIRKAIGWTLREWSKPEPQRVLDFAESNREKMAPLSYREATRKIDPLSVTVP